MDHTQLNIHIVTVFNCSLRPITCSITTAVCSGMDRLIILRLYNLIEMAVLYEVDKKEVLLAEDENPEAWLRYYSPDRSIEKAVQ